MAGPLAKKDKPVTREDFVAMVSERLMAVAKDRDTMKKRAQDQARQQGKSYEEIMVSFLKNLYLDECFHIQFLVGSNW